MRGPRSKTLTNKKRKIQFKVVGKGMLLILTNLNWGERTTEETTILSDSDIRKLRDWLNWYLDNK